MPPKRKPTGQDLLPAVMMDDNELKWKKDRLFKELYQLKEKNEVEASDLTTSVQGMHLRHLRRKRRELQKDIKKLTWNLQK